MTVCEKCQSPAIEGPEGGYVCGQCFHVVEPRGYDKRRREGLQRMAAERRNRTAQRNAKGSVQPCVSPRS